MNKRVCVIVNMGAAMDGIIIKWCLRGIVVLGICATIVNHIERSPVQAAQDMRIEAMENTSVHYPSLRTDGLVQLVSADPHFSGISVEAEDAQPRIASIKVSSGWSVNRTAKSSYMN